MATQMLPRGSALAGDKSRTVPSDDVGLNNSFHSRRTPQSPVFIPPNEFRMKLLKRILSVDGTIDNKALKKLQKTSSERTLQANILFENGDVGTLISLDRNKEESERKEPENNENDGTLPPVQTQQEKKLERPRDGLPRERPLKLPPIMLPPVYTLAARPLMVRDYSGPPYIPPPPEEEDWEDLQDCRYLRPAKKQFKATKGSKSFLLLNSS
ncbi:uncharacterized protein LOC128211177 [Mya arenaria]|uniref:uncharacterized protein LOC128211177 n=1 Tax=Mya arenaria TaxID=6604 RepID=UPI0022E6FFF3|nr:uncharacterized protein LOC128211177 [Mya arenaria]